MKYARLKVDKVGLFTPTSVCDTNAVGTSVSLSCDLGNPEGDYIYTLLAHFYSETILDQETISTVETSHMGEAGLFAAIALVISLGFIGLWSPAAAVILSFIALLFAGMFELIYIQYAALVGIGVVALVMVVKMR